jgi:alkylhydroperoxidase family enzyme
MFLKEPTGADALAYLEKDRVQTGYVMNLERAWAWRPDVAEAFALLRRQLLAETSLTPREVALLVCATARALGDPYCSLAWGTRLAGLRGAAAVAEILRGMDPPASTAREVALRQWVGRIVSDPNSASAMDIQLMRIAGLSDREIFEATVHVAFRLAFSIVNGSLGAIPDHQLVAAAPPQVRAEITYGRPAAMQLINHFKPSDFHPTGDSQ